MLIVLPTMVIAMGDGIMDMGIHMAANSVEMEDAVGSATWTEIQGGCCKNGYGYKRDCRKNSRCK